MRNWKQGLIIISVVMVVVFSAMITLKKETTPIKYSAFIFFDVNNNGVYDTADRPMAGVENSLLHPNGRLDTAISNVHGFANFFTNETLKRQGDYVFSAMPPPNFRATTTTSRTTSARLENGKVRMLTLPDPIGFSQKPQISHTSDTPIWAKLANSGETPILLSPDKPSTTDNQNTALEYGLVEITDNNSNISVILGSRAINLGSKLGKITTYSPPKTITFEEQDLLLHQAIKIPNNYGGLNWNGLTFNSGSGIAGGFGYANSLVSGARLAYNSSGVPAEIYSDTPFSLHEMYITLAWPAKEKEVSAIFEYFDHNNTLIRTDVVPVTHYGPIRYMPLQSGISRVKLHSTNYRQLAIDNVVYSQD